MPAIKQVHEVTVFVYGQPIIKEVLAFEPVAAEALAVQDLLPKLTDESKGSKLAVAVNAHAKNPM